MILDSGNSIKAFQVYTTLYCREMADNTKLKIRLIRGELVFIESAEDVCEGIKHNNLYDSKKWQINTRVYYFNGDKDPVLPLYQAEYHYNSQVTKDKIFVTIKGAAHGALTSLSKCSMPLWKDILNNKTKLSESISRCDYDFEIK